MKKIIVFSALLLTGLMSRAQQSDTVIVPKLWTRGGMGYLNFGQGSFTNWSTGGENSVSLGAFVNLFANYKKRKSTLDNSLTLAYGALKVGSAARVNDDRIDLTSKYGRNFYTRNWYFSIILNFKSQFTNGYNYPNDSVVVSHFFAPAYLLNAYGIDFRGDNNSLSLFISPLTSKFIFVNDQRLANQGAYGVKPARYDTVGGAYGIVEYGDKVLYQFGGYFKLYLQKDIYKNVNFATKLELFSNYLKDPQNIVVNWENIIGLKVNKYITSTISTVMIYDHNIPVPVKEVQHGVTVIRTGPRLQFKEVLAIGLSYKF